MLVTGLLFSFPDSDLPVLAPWTQLNAYQHHKNTSKTHSNLLFSKISQNPGLENIDHGYGAPLEDHWSCWKSLAS